MAEHDTQTPATREVPFYRPDIGEEEISAVTDALRSGWLTMGPKTQEFEAAFATAVEAQCAVAVNSCTAALHLALDALDLHDGDEVITSPITFAATGATIIHAGGRPVFADCSDDTLNIDPEDVARKITPRTRAIIPVHLAGHPAPMDELRALATAHHLTVIEDAAHALPAKYKGQPIGSPLSDMTAFSFYATKNLTTGEGGMLTLHDEDMATRVRMRRLHGLSKDAWKRYSAKGAWRYDISYPGFKYNMVDTAAAMGLVQLQRLPSLYARRCQIVAQYNAQLADVPHLRLPSVRPEVESAWHLYAVRVRPDTLRIDRDTLIELLREVGIGTSVHFIPLHVHSYYRETFTCPPEALPVASAAAETMMSLPLFTTMTDEDVTYVTDQLRTILTAHAR